MECKECCREITSQEAKDHDGYCKKCYSLKEKNYEDEDENENVEVENKIANVIHIIGTLLVFIGPITGFIYTSENTWLGIVIIISSIVTSIFIAGFAEIIQLLEDIKNKL